MIISQLSVFLENKKGRLCAATDVLADAGINIRALTLADTSEFGILRLIVDKPDEAKDALINSGVVVRITKVVAIAMDDVPGGADAILHLITESGLNIEYIYACVGHETGKALMILRTDDNEGAETILKSHGYNEIDPADIYRL